MGRVGRECSCQRKSCSWSFTNSDTKKEMGEKRGGAKPPGPAAPRTTRHTGAVQCWRCLWQCDLIFCWEPLRAALVPGNTTSPLKNGQHERDRGEGRDTRGAVAAGGLINSSQHR